MIDFRHRLAHGYDTVDRGRLWLAATSQLPQLIAQLDDILGPEENA